MKDKPISAREANKITRRCAPVRTTGVAVQYVVVEPRTGETFTGRLEMVAGLCPKVKCSTLRARLAKGERNLERLRRKPDSPRGRKMK